MTLSDGPPRHRLSKYLLRNEEVVVGIRRHPVAVWEPIATTAGSLVAILIIGFTAAPGTNAVIDALWKLWLVVVLRMLYRVWEWRREYFIATDRRIMLIYGFITKKVAMLPLAKVTDMTYHRSIMGRLLGFGTFVIESAGQDQALREVHYVPHPDETYRRVIGQIFARPGEDDDEEPPVTDDDDLVASQSGSRRGRLRAWAAPFASLVAGRTPPLQSSGTASGTASGKAKTSGERPGLDVIGGAGGGRSIYRSEDDSDD